MRLFLAVAAVAVLTACGGTAQATVITFSTAPGATEAGGNPVSATATFTTSDGSINIQVTNTLVNPTTIAQNISDLAFTLSSGQTSGTLSGSSGLSRTVASDGTFVDNGVVSPTAWTLDATALHLTVLGNGQPKQTIIGAPDGSGVYSNANNSIAGNDPHNPFLAGTVSFDVAIAGLTAGDTVTSVTFSFGTDAGNDVPGVPEPTSMLLMGGIFAGLGVFGYRRKKLQTVTA
jgi:hypothetical protein